MNNCVKGLSERISECEKTLISEGYTLISERNKLYRKNNIEYAIIYWGYVVYVRYYPRSVNTLILASKFGDIYSYNPEKDTLKKVGYGVNKNGYRTSFLPTGVYDDNGYLIYLHRTVSSVVLWAWTQKKPTVNELKVIKGIGIKVKMYNTVIIAEFQNKHHTSDEDYCLSNLEWNFVKRGKRHWKSVIGNDPVKDARGLMLRGEFPSNREFKEKWDLSVSDSAISQMKYAYTWQVRTEPIAPMTNPMENLKDNIG